MQFRKYGNKDLYKWGRCTLPHFPLIPPNLVYVQLNWIVVYVIQSLINHFIVANSIG